MIFRVYIMFIFALYLAKVNTQNEKNCTNNVDCFAEVKSKLKFICTQNGIRDWFLGKNQLCDGKAGIVEQYRSDYTILSGLYFGIKSLNPLGLSKLKYFANQTDFDETECNIDIFTYDSKNYAGNVSINNLTKHINETITKIEIQIDTFTVPLAYSFYLERLPLDNLTVNGSIVSSVPCNHTRQYPSLNCLESSKQDLILNKCMSNYTLSFDYTANDLKKYQNANITLQQNAFDHYIQFKFPPKVKNKSIHVTINTRNNTSLFDLTCELECSSETLHSISWFALNGTESKLIKTSDEFKLNSSEFNFNETSVVYCLISSSVQYTDKNYQNESITYFHLNFVDPATATTAIITTSPNSSAMSITSNFGQKLSAFLLSLLLYIAI